MRFKYIASGSNGNSAYVGSDTTSLLVDTGITAKRISDILSADDISMNDIDGILITHEHIDHIKGLGVISRKYNIPIYATYGTIDGILKCTSLGTFDYNLFQPISNSDSFNIGDITINVHSISHDTPDPVCYSFQCDGKKCAIATDMGTYDNFTIDFLKDSDVMLIEANHDIRMLEVGPYPYILKKRILGDRGHLCNEMSGKLIRELLNDHIKGIWLGHLSEQNNFEELAFATVKSELEGNPYSDDVRDFGLEVSSRTMPGRLVEF